MFMLDAIAQRPRQAGDWTSAQYTAEQIILTSWLEAEGLMLGHERIATRRECAHTYH